jgi:hypothetical protein
MPQGPPTTPVARLPLYRGYRVVARLTEQTWTFDFLSVSGFSHEFLRITTIALIPPSEHSEPRETKHA